MSAVGASPEVLDALTNEAPIIKPQSMMGTIEWGQLNKTSLLFVTVLIDVPPDNSVEEEIIGMNIAAECVCLAQVDRASADVCS